MENTENLSNETNTGNTHVIGLSEQLISREILSCGVNTLDKINHFGSGYKNSIFFRYLLTLKNQGVLSNLGLLYNSIEPNEERQKELRNLYEQDSIGTSIEFITSSMQEYLDESADSVDWSIITGVFDKNIYEHQQYQFIDKMITSSLNLSNEGVIFTFDSNYQDEFYNIDGVIRYVNNTYNRYRISKIDERHYVICIYKYYHSSTN
jgi:hypothetical protein